MELHTGEMGNIITRVIVTEHFVRSTLLETASADSWVGDLPNVFLEGWISLYKATSSETDAGDSRVRFAGTL